jgi:hypothetical protein
VDESMVWSDYRNRLSDVSGDDRSDCGSDAGIEGVLISAINSHRKVRFMFSNGPLSLEAYIEFVSRLLISEAGPIFLIADGDPIHRAMAVQQLAEQSDGRLQLFQLPV